MHSLVVRRFAQRNKLLIRSVVEGAKRPRQPVIIWFLTIPTDFMIVDQKISKKTVFLAVYYNNLDIKQKAG